jgi:uncharacterized protein YbjT (DUF2867 family)
VCPGLAWFLLGGARAATVDRDGNANLVEAAAAAGADLVLMSTVGTAANSPMELFRMKRAAEGYASASGVPTTVVRATVFAEMARSLEIGGLGNLSFDELTRAVQTAAGRTSAPRHVPPAVLRLWAPPSDGLSPH